MCKGLRLLEFEYASRAVHRKINRDCSTHCHEGIIIVVEICTFFLCPSLLERFIIILVAIRIYTSVLLCLNASSLSWWQSTLIPLSFSARTLHHHPGGNPHLYLCPFLLERFIIILVAIHTYTSVLFCVNAASLSWLKSTLIPLSCSAQTLYHHPGGNPHLIPLSCAARTRNHHPGGNPHFFLRPALLERLKTALYADMSDLRKTCN